MIWWGWLVVALCRFGLRVIVLFMFVVSFVAGLDLFGYRFGLVVGCGDLVSMVCWY